MSKAPEQCGSAGSGTTEMECGKSSTLQEVCMRKICGDCCTEHACAVLLLQIRALKSRYLTRMPKQWWQFSWAPALGVHCSSCSCSSAHHCGNPCAHLLMLLYVSGV